jgi:flagellar hook-length control protein FliK
VTSSAASGARGPAGADSSASRIARSSADGSSIDGSSADGSSTDGPSAAGGSGAGSSDSSRSKTSGKASSAEPGNSTGDSRAGRRTGRGSGASSASSAGTAPPARGGTDDFSAALAQSLASTPAEGAVSVDITAAKGKTESGTGQPSEHAAKHSAADPVSTALTLLEHSLAAALLGTPPTPAATTAATTASPASPSPAGHSTAAAKSTATVLNTLVAQDLATAAKVSGSSPVPATASSGAAGQTAETGAATSALAAAAQLTAASHVGSQQPKSDLAPMTLSSPVGSSTWTDELGAKVTWMAHQGIESASLQLTPEHLGPLQVSISVHNGQASVWFGAAQPDTRTALQQSLPQLRQLFASQGLTLADAGVSREPPRGQGRQQPARAAAPVSGITAVNSDGSARASIAAGLGLVDTYA